jgi:undecaprenyl-phosphate galactose phosphotransferase
MILSDIAGILLAWAFGTLASDSLREVLAVDSGGTYGLFGPRIAVLPVLIGLTIGVFGFGGLYQRGGWEVDEFKRLVAAIALIALFDAALAYVTRDHFSRLWFVVTWPTAMVLIIAFRMVLRTFAPIQRLMTTNMVMVGTGLDREEFCYQIRESRSGPIRVQEGLPLPELARMHPSELSLWLDEVADRAGIAVTQLHTVILPSDCEAAAARSLTRSLDQLDRPFFVAVSHESLARRGVALHQIAGSDVVLAGVSPDRWPRIDRAVKRFLDVLLSFAGVLLTLPLLLLISALLLADGGPIFFRQLRVGKGRRRFQCLKFRTMRVDAEERLALLLDANADANAEWVRHQKLEDDPRVTRLGLFLRASSLDELPQLLNVLKGEMSLVGPRPIIAPEVPGYDKDRSYFESKAFRDYARCVPGITGLWQVSGRHRTEHRERVRLDRWYARNWSLWLDLAILFKTFRAVFGRSGG